MGYFQFCLKFVFSGKHHTQEYIQCFMAVSLVISEQTRLLGETVILILGLMLPLTTITTTPAYQEGVTTSHILHKLLNPAGQAESAEGNGQTMF